MVNIIGSDYQVLRDTSVKIEDGETKRLSFRRQVAIFGSNDVRDRAILSFNIRPAQSGRLTVSSGGTSFSGPSMIMDRIHFSKSHKRMHQEAFDLVAIIHAEDASIGEPIGSLKIDFHVEDGPIILSDIVIHHKIIIPLP